MWGREIVEKKETGTEVGKRNPLKKWTGRHYLLGMLIIGLLLWGESVIERALQPKYQGKTAEEWFESESLRDVMFASPEATKNGPVVVAFKNLGPKGVRYLWEEYTREHALITDWLAEIAGRITGTHDPFQIPSFAEPTKAYILLMNLGPDAEPIVPDLLELLLIDEPGYAVFTANLLGSIKRQPQTVVPALSKVLTLSKPSQDDRIACIRAIGQFGPEAASQLPVLEARLKTAGLKREERTALAGAIWRISGDGAEFKHILEQTFSTDKSGITSDHESMMSALEELGPVAKETVAMLEEHARSGNSVTLSNRVSEIILKLDPERSKQKP
jgi:hypothetical protein